MKNYSELIKSKSERTLTAKGCKFLHKFITVVAESKGVHRMHPEFKATKEKIRTVIHDLIIDKEFTANEIIDLIKQRKLIY